MEIAAFYGFAGLAIFSALFILFTKNLMYAALALFLSFLGVAAMYVFAMADFLAVSQIMIYVGGVLVLLVFGIMLTQSEKSYKNTGPNDILVQNKGIPVGLALSGILLFVLIKIVGTVEFALAVGGAERKSTLHDLGVKLMTTHLLPFEIIAILLLAVLIGAGYMAYNRIKHS